METVDQTLNDDDTCEDTFSVADWCTSSSKYGGRGALVASSLLPSDAEQLLRVRKSMAYKTQSVVPHKCCHWKSRSWGLCCSQTYVSIALYTASRCQAIATHLKSHMVSGVGRMAWNATHNTYMHWWWYQQIDRYRCCDQIQMYSNETYGLSNSQWCWAQISFDATMCNIWSEWWSWC